jgi:3-hydroxy-9,10-secoandrosta-1,3,5(10)-triene-9,17-dione monooxygenase
MRSSRAAGPEGLVEAPEPDLTPAQLIKRARDMRVALRERQALCEELTRIPDETHQAFLEAGFYRTLQPRRFGGYEFDMSTFDRLIMEVARGCPSSAWNLALASNHSLVVAQYFGEQAQREIFGPAGDFRAPLPVAPTGMAVRDGDGYLVNGRWDYASGCTISTHFLAVTMVDNADGGPPVPGLVCVPEGWEVLDNWGDTIGMRGSGSNSVVVSDVPVPERYVVCVDIQNLDLSGATEGLRIHGNPLYAGQTVSFFNLVLVPIIVGTAQAAIDEYGDILSSKRSMVPPIKLRREEPEHQRIFGLATARVGVAQRTLLAVADEWLALARRGAAGGEPFSVLEDHRLAAVLREAGQLAAGAVADMAAASGTSASKDGQRMQRYLRDVLVYRTHINGQHGYWARRLGADLLGAEEVDWR